MPSAANTIGPLALPVPAGAQDSSLDDATLTGILAYLGHWLSASLDAKVFALRGTNASTVGACPVANRFPWDPASYFVRGDEAGNGAIAYFPALYAWRIGRPQRERYSTTTIMRRQSIGVSYIFDELTLPGGWEARSGLLNVVDAVFTTAAEWNYHPTFSLNSEPLGTPFSVGLRLSGGGFQYDGGEQGVMSPVPSESRTRGAGADGHVLRGYPVLRSQFTVWERIEQATPVDPDDIGREWLLTLQANTEGDMDNPLEIMQRVLPSPDGTEDQ